MSHFSLSNPQFTFELGFLIGFFLGVFNDFVTKRMVHWVTRLWYRCKGWKKVKSPWPLFERTYKSGLKYRATNFEGMKAADKRYGQTGTPEHKL